MDGVKIIAHLDIIRILTLASPLYFGCTWGYILGACFEANTKFVPWILGWQIGHDYMAKISSAANLKHLSLVVAIGLHEHFPKTEL